ncbi:ABC transporter ATP-binding protein [Kitasatospora sp. NA04385]|uniref:ABC transporter ATP-binding protein n=1 Tax=Kitasatospora sp. NA04385 TaxID=2742135 RepID=UPI00158FD7DE|nr:ABC transporter ATP-binding protein [Kitasatospora sp. NA04385]QKW20717.1 ABC transporter ATP-binding protein [Kitasatospora sp. NA04385]
MTDTSRSRPAVEARGLHRRYGPSGAAGFEAVRGLDLGVAPGELFALLGTNGAGKTSTLEVLEGLAGPSAGEVRVLGLDPRRDRAALRPRIGIMLQEGGFPGELTLAETGRCWAGLTTGARAVDEALDLVGLLPRRSVRVKQLSGGERRRLDLAMALLGRPEVLFLDEPSTGLDPEARAAVWRLIRDLRTAGTTVVLTTHYLEEAEELADRLAIMHHGRVVTGGTVAEVLAAHPARIGFELPGRTGEPAAPALPPLPGTSTELDGRRVLLRTHDLQGTLTELLGWAARHRVELARLDARSASLEEAFLAVAASPADPASPGSPAAPSQIGRAA